MMRAVAIKQGQSRVVEKTFQTMGTVTCDNCGESFFIGHYPAYADPKEAASQAKWLEKVLAYDHERERKHPDKIDLP
jgi:hypothetical protein